METIEKLRVELTYGRFWETRFMGHLDLMRAMARALRRADLPVYFSEGFNPRPKISGATPPLPVGHTSECERIVFFLMETSSGNEILERLRAVMPEGIEAMDVRAGEQETKSSGTAVISYVILIPRSLGIELPASTKILLKDSEYEALGTDEITARILGRADGNESFLKENFSFGINFSIETGVRMNDIAEALSLQLGITPENSYQICFHRLKITEKPIN